MITNARIKLSVLENIKLLEFSILFCSNLVKTKRRKETTSCSSSDGAVAVVEPTSMSTEVVTVKTEAGMGGEEVRVVRFLGVRGGAEGELDPSSSSFKARASSSSCLDRRSSYV